MFKELQKINPLLYSKENLLLSIEVLDIVLTILDKNPTLLKGFWARFKRAIPTNYNKETNNEKSFEIVFLIFSSKDNIHSLFENYDHNNKLSLLQKIKI